MKCMTRCLVLFFALFLCVGSVGAAEKDWTFMVYVNCDNNLDSFGVGDVEEMARIGSNDWMDVVALVDRYQGSTTLNYIEKNNIKLLEDYGDLDTGDYKVFVDFVTKTAKQYPAKHYCVVMWNHGSGWKNLDGQVFKGISYDETSGNNITTAQLTTATAQIKKALGKNLDILACDACLMQMIEVVYAVKDSVDVFVASEETEPGEGYPYHGILGGAKKGMTTAQFAENMVKKYAVSYDGGDAGNSSTTQSAIDCSKIDALKDAVDGFAKAVIAGNYSAQVKDALAKVQKFYYRTNIDLPHLVKLLKVSIDADAFQTAAGKLEAALDKAVISNAVTGWTTANSGGLAIYFPASSYSFANAYLDLAFAKKSLWDEMVQDFYKKITAPTIVADVENGDISSLLTYVETANENNREVSADLIAKLNFRTFSEGGLSESIQENVSTLLKELKSK